MRGDYVLICRGDKCLTYPPCILIHNPLAFKLAVHEEQIYKCLFGNITIKITRVVNLPLEFWTVGCRKLITWWPKEVVTWHKKVVMWFLWNGLTVMAFNKEGWFYERGKGPSEELKGQIIDKIHETGGDRILGYFPAKWTKLGDKFGVSD